MIREPTQLQNLSLWISASAVTGVADGGKITTAPDLSGSGVVVTQAVDANRPLYQLVNGLPTIRFGTPGVVMRWFGYSGVSWPISPLTVVVLGKVDDPADLTQNTLLTFGPDHTVRTVSVQQKMACWTNTTDAAFSTGLDVPSGEFLGIFTVDANARTADKDGARVILNGNENFRSRSPNGDVIGNATITAGNIGVGHTGPGLGFNGYIRDLLVFRWLLTSAERAEVIEYLRVVRGASRGAAPTQLLIFDGDSLTNGSTGTSPDQARTYPERVLSAQLPCSSRNFGITGATIANLASDAATQIDAQFSAAYQRNVVFAWIGSNDLLNTPGTAATVFADYKAYCAARRSAGFKVVAFTCLPRGAIAQFETDRLAFNVSVRADTSFYNALADIASDSRIGAAGAQNDLTYYQGGAVHLNVTGLQIVADYVIAALVTIP